MALSGHRKLYVTVWWCLYVIVSIGYIRGWRSFFPQKAGIKNMWHTVDIPIIIWRVKAEIGLFNFISCSKYFRCKPGRLWGSHMRTTDRGRRFFFFPFLYLSNFSRIFTQQPRASLYNCWLYSVKYLCRFVEYSAFKRRQKTQHTYIDNPLTPILQSRPSNGELS